jgi:hypothetical protein
MRAGHDWRAIQWNLFYNGKNTEVVSVVVGGFGVVRAWFLDCEAYTLDKGSHQ